MSRLLTTRVSIPCLLALGAALGGCDRESPASRQDKAIAAANVASDEVTSGEVVSSGPAAPQIGIDRSHKGEPAPTTSFKGPDGKPTSLVAFRGKPVLVNLWATWCGPCVAELPTLEAAARAWTGKVAVIAVSQDTQRTDGVPAFLTAHGAKTLVPYLDDKMALSLGYGANLPTTVLYDSAGKEVWRWSGGNDWTSEKTRALIAEAA